MFRLCAFVVLATLLGCASNNDRVVVLAPTAQGSVRIGVSTLELRDISLPAYASTDEIAIQNEAGGLVTDAAVMWADEPARAISLELTRHLSSLTRARIAPQPWPFEALPQATLDVRFETLLPRADGRYDVVGRYFVGRLDGGAERAGSFEFSVSIAQPVNARSVSEARGRAISQLAGLLARQALR